MKNLLKFASVAAFAIGLAACADQTATSPDTMAATTTPAAMTTTTTITETTHMKHKSHKHLCQSLKSQIKMTAPSDQATLDHLNAQLNDLNCGTK